MPSDHERQQRPAPVAAVVSRSARAAPRAPRRTRSGPSVSPSSRSSCWKWRISSSAAARREPEQRQEPDQRAERQLGAVDQRRDHAADERDRQRSGTPAPRGASSGSAACSSRKIAIAAAMREREHPAGADLLAGRRPAAPPRGTRAGSSTLREAVLDVARDVADAAAADVGFDVEAARHRVALDRRPASARRARRRPRRGGRGRRPGVSISRLRTSSTLRRVSGTPCTIDVEDLLLLEDAADLDALQQRGLRAAHVARLDAAALRLVEVDLDLDVRLRRRAARHAGSTTPSTLGHQLPDPRRLAAQDVLVLAEDPHDERLVRSGQHVEAVARDRVLALDQRPDVPDLLRRVGDDVVRRRRGTRSDGVLDRRDASRRSRRRSRC